MRSFRGRRWEVAEADAALAAEIARAAAVSPLTGRILAARGFSPEEARRFVDPTLRELMPDPLSLLGMADAVARVRAALAGGERICVWGDYDVDGACSAALLVRVLRALGADPSFRIPDRLTEGYGPNEAGVRALAAEGVRLLVVVDAGTTAFGPLEAAADAGMDVVVLDHHAAEDALPRAVAVVNPNRRDQAPGLGHLCAAGVCFLFAVALVAAERAAGRRGLPDLRRWLDLVALATVADVVPLRGLNRAFVRHGLRRMSAPDALPGIGALARAAGISGPMEAGHLGFGLGPRINAGGRVGDAAAGTRLLVSDDAVEAAEIARRLDAWNRERQEIEKACLEEARGQVDPSAPVAFAAGEGWHEGVVGIVASRLKDAADRPAFVFARAQDGTWKGSGRSVAGFDLGAAVIAARAAGLLLKGGGHAMAAGATCAADGLPAFRAFLEAAVLDSGVVEGGVSATADLVVPLGMLDETVPDAMWPLEPFGPGNPTPRILVPRVRVRSAELLKGLHLRAEVEGDGRRLKAIAFQAGGTALAAGVLGAVGREIDLLGVATVNEWNGRRAVELRLEDARLSEAR
jgi:single-stranded-DNA-specific exonuclease